MNKLLRASILASFALAACGKTVSLEDRPCPCASGFTCCADRNVCVADGTSCSGAPGGSGSGAAPPGGFSASSVSSAQTLCQNATHGPSDPAISPADAASKLTRAWLACVSDPWFSDRGGDGIVFSSDGTWSVLKRDGAGALAPLAGHENKGTWSLYKSGSSAPLDPTDSQSGSVDEVGLRDSDAFGGSPEVRTLVFERDPQRLELVTNAYTPPDRAWLVPLEGSPTCDDPSGTCQCHAQCARILAQACDSYSAYANWYSSRCVDSCEAATASQRQALAACNPASPCDPACFLDVDFDPSSGNPGKGVDAGAGSSGSGGS